MSLLSVETPKDTLDLLDDLHDILVVENVLDSNTLRLMLDRGSPYKATVCG